MTRKPKGIRVSAISGITAPPLMVGLWIVASILRPGYDQFTQRGSELTTGPDSLVMNANFAVTGILIVVFSLGLVRTMRGGTLLKAGLAFLCLCGLAEIAASPFPCDPGCPLTGSLSQMIHTGVAVVFYGSVAIFPLFIGLGLGEDPNWQVYRPYSLATGLASVVLFSAFSIAVLSSFQFVGLIQRLLLALPFLWIEAMGIHLRSLSRVGLRAN